MKSRRKSGYNPVFAKGIVFTALLLSIVISLAVFSKPASGEEQAKTKYFKSIEIEAGDSLWSIAEEYMSEEYDDIFEYIDELKKMNGLTGDGITAGCNLVVAYYSDEIK